jgi:hypothetical protein
LATEKKFNHHIIGDGMFGRCKLGKFFYRRMISNRIFSIAIGLVIENFQSPSLLQPICFYHQTCNNQKNFIAKLVVTEMFLSLQVLRRMK